MRITRTQYGDAYAAGHEKTIHFLMARGLPEGEAEDAAQAAWTRGWEKRDMLRRPDSLVGWINSIALNIFRNKYRRDKRLEQLPDRDIAVTADRLGSRVDVDRGLEHCSASDQALLKELYIGGYSSKEIGRHWHLKPSTVRVRVFRAKAKLREFLEGSAEAERLSEQATKH